MILQIYNFSKIKRFMLRINYVAEDTLRFVVHKCVTGYAAMIYRFCPISVQGKILQIWLFPTIFITLV